MIALGRARNGPSNGAAICHTAEEQRCYDGTANCHGSRRRARANPLRTQRDNVLSRKTEPPHTPGTKFYHFLLSTGGNGRDLDYRLWRGAEILITDC